MAADEMTRGRLQDRTGWNLGSVKKEITNQERGPLPGILPGEGSFCMDTALSLHKGWPLFLYGAEIFEGETSKEEQMNTKKNTG